MQLQRGLCPWSVKVRSKMWPT